LIHKKLNIGAIWYSDFHKQFVSGLLKLVDKDSKQHPYVLALYTPSIKANTHHFFQIVGGVIRENGFGTWRRPWRGVAALLKLKEKGP